MQEYVEEIGTKEDILWLESIKETLVNDRRMLQYAPLDDFF